VQRRACERKHRGTLGAFGSFLGKTGRGYFDRTLYTEMNKKSELSMGVDGLLIQLCRMLVPSDIKKCLKCGSFKPLSGFHKSKRGAKGVKAQCKDCLRPYHAKHGKLKTFRRQQLNANKPKKTCILCRVKKPINQFKGSSQRFRTCLECYQRIADKREQRIKSALFGKLNSHERREALLTALHDGSMDTVTLTGLFAKAKSCPYCGVKLRSSNKTLDHMVPISKGGVHGKSNCLICCRSCNSRKSDRDFDEWLNLLEKESGDRLRNLYKRMHGAPPAQKTLTMIYNQGERVA
jgi:5-methylcytosine-specific restriction endonuclease McrA